MGGQEARGCTGRGEVGGKNEGLTRESCVAARRARRAGKKAAERRGGSQQVFASHPKEARRKKVRAGVGGRQGRRDVQYSGGGTDRSAVRGGGGGGGARGGALRGTRRRHTEARFDSSGCGHPSRRAGKREERAKQCRGGLPRGFHAGPARCSRGHVAEDDAPVRSSAAALTAHRSARAGLPLGQAGLPLR